MKILITTPDLNLPGGVANYYKTIKPYFTYTVDYFSVGRRDGEVSFLQSLSRAVDDYFKFWLKIVLENYNLVHINPSLGSKSFIRDAILVLIAKIFRKKVLVFFRGWDLEYEVYARKKFMWLFRISYLWSDGMVVLAKEFKHKLRTMGYKKAIYIETTVVSNEVFDRSPNIKSSLENSSISLLFLSRIEKNKGIYEVIDAVSTLQEKYPKLSLTVAGSGDDLNDVKEYVNNTCIKNVSFTGYIVGEEKSRVFGEADIFVFPTYYGEGMPNAVLEAMAYGIPVITRPVGGISDFFQDGRMGYLVTEADVELISSRIEKLINDDELRVDISNYNRIYAEQRFKADKVVSRLEKIYANF